jgi:hypothetical protein
MAETQLTDVFVEMADALVADFDLADPLHVLTERCVQLLDVCAAGLLLTDQRSTLQTAPDDRILIEQTKSMLVERLRLDMDQAFALLRQAARTHNQRLPELARAVLDGTEQISSAAPSPTAAAPIRRRP